MSESQGKIRLGLWRPALVLAALLVSFTGSTLAQSPGQGQTRAAGGAGAVRPLELRQTLYRLRAGAPARIAAPQETLDFILNAQRRSVTIGGTEARGFVLGPGVAGDEVLLAASLTTPPGNYTLTISATSKDGEERAATLEVILNPPQPVPSTATRPPVVLLNGWQISFTNSCPISSGSSDTFGSLASQLQSDGVPVVYFLDNCVECPNCSIEGLGNSLGQVMNLIRYGSGALVPQIDLVAHSMGGLIVRAYLSGLQADGSLSPPISPRVRKFIEIATPNFGSFLATSAAGLLGDQADEMIPGSAFLWNLATWNQRGDDLRGVDALAVIGNGGYAPSSGFPPPKASDGVVSLTSSSLGFARDATRTRIVPYCHTDSSGIVGLFMDCNGSGVAKAPETSQIVRSFLADTTAWTSIGSTASSDPYLSLYGGMYFALQNASAQWVTDLTQVLFGTISLQQGYAVGENFYTEFVNGTGTLQATSKSLGTVNCGSFTESVGYYSTVRCKLNPLISSVGPLLSNVPGWVVKSGAPVTITGSGFGQQCSTCQVVAYPGPVVLQVSSWSDQTITAFLPGTYTGFVQLAVQTAAGSDAINFMAGLGPALSISPQSLQLAYTIGGALPTQTVNLTNAGAGTLSWTAAPDTSWLAVSPSSGTAPSTLTITINPAGLIPGSYSGSVTVSSPGSQPQQITVTLTVASAAPAGPVITSVVNGASLLAGIQNNSWIAIRGTNLSSTTRMWEAQRDIANGILPTLLDGVSVKINGKLAVVYYISPTQLNVLAPIDSTVGPILITVSNANGTSAPYTPSMQRYSPGFFVFGAQGGKYAAATHADGSYLGPPGLYGGAPDTQPARPGEVIVLYGTGFGATDPPAPSDRVFSGALLLVDQVTITIGGVQADVQFAGMSGPGLCQFNVVVPDLPEGDQPVTATIGGLQTQAGVFVTLRQ